MELIFPIATHILLCFGGVAGKVLATHTSVLALPEQCLHSIKAVTPTLLSHSSRAGSGQDLGRGHSQDI